MGLREYVVIDDWGVGRHPQRCRRHVLNMNRFLVYSFDRENGEFTSKKRALTHKYNRL
jgi:hypothetical protein